MPGDRDEGGIVPAATDPSQAPPAPDDATRGADVDERAATPAGEAASTIDDGTDGADVPAPVGVRAISGGALAIRHPAEFETILGTADEITVELPDALDIFDLVRGTTIAGHVVLARHAEDQLGPIYTAYDSARHQRVKLRLIPFAPETGSVARQAALVESLAAIARVSHPCIVPIHDVGLWTGGVYVASAFVEGITAREWIEARDDPFPWREVLRVFREVGRGVVAAHTVGVQHRDLSPDRIVIGEGGQVAVADFGLAASTDEADPDADASIDALCEHLGIEPRAATNPLVGTLEYAAPEVVAGGTADRASDQFSFCVALYEALYGERPFVGTDRAALARQYVVGQPRPAPADARVPAWLRDVVLRGLAVSPSARWPTMELLVREIDRDPAASRRRWRRASAVLAVLATTGGVLAWQADRATSACARSAEAFTGVWDQARRAELEQAFLATGAAHAAQNFAATAEIIDTWADSWVDQQVSACEGRRTQGEFADEIYHERRACLDVRQDELRSMLAVFDDASPAELDRAAFAAESLTATGVCARRGGVAALRKTVDVHDERLADLRRRVDRGWVLLRLGNATAAAALVADIDETAADDLVYPGFEVAALRLRGAAEYALGHRTEAESLLHASALGASRLRFDQPLVLAWIDLAMLAAASPEGHHTEAVRLLDHASVTVDRAHLTEDRWRIAMVRGELAAATGKAGDALVHYRTALEELDRSADHPWARNDLLVRTASLIARQGDATAGLNYLLRAYEDAQRRLGSNHPALAEILLRIGDVRLQQRNPVEARTSWERATALVSAANGPTSRPAAMMMLAIAKRLRDDADARGALEYNRRALQAATEGSDADAGLRAAALEDHGRTLLALARDDEAQAPLRQAFEIHDAAWRAAAKDASPSTRRAAAQRWVDASVLLARALWADPSTRERAIEHGRAARAVAADNGVEIDPWVLELTRRDPIGAER